MGQFGQIVHSHTYSVPFHTRKVFTTLRVNNLSFSGRTIPLFTSMLVTQGEGSTILTEPHHTPSPQEQHSPHHDPSSPSHQTTSTKPIPQTLTETPTETPTKTPTLRRYTRRAIQIAQSKALSPTADEPASLLRDDRQGEDFPTVSILDAGQDRENINKTSALPHESSPRIAAKLKDQDLEISGLKARVKFLEDKDRGSAEPTQEDAPIKGGIKEIGEEVGAEKSTELGSNDTKEMVNVLSSMEAANILTSGVAAASVQLLVFLLLVEVFPLSVQFLPLPVWSNEVIAKHLQKYEQAEEKLTVRERIELINELVKYQDHHAKILKYQAQQSKPLSKKEQREFYMSVLNNHAGWKTKHFRGMTLKEIKEKFIPVWKQLEDFVPMSSKEEGKRVKRKGLKLDQGSAKRMKTSEDVSKEDLKGMMQLVPLEEVYVEALQRRSTSAIDFGEGNFKYQTSYKRQRERVMGKAEETV
nr:hypothetical protein [Tanacetum cinerariifolium]